MGECDGRRGKQVRGRVAFKGASVVAVPSYTGSEDADERECFTYF